MLQRKVKGDWILLASATSKKPLSVSHCPLPDVGQDLPPPPPGASTWVVQAMWLGGTMRKRKRLEQLASLADENSGAYDSERKVAQRLLSREIGACELTARQAFNFQHSRLQCETIAPDTHTHVETKQ